MTIEEWKVEQQPDSGAIWERVYIKQGDAIIAILDDMLCGDRRALELAGEIAGMYNERVGA